MGKLHYAFRRAFASKISGKKFFQIFAIVKIQSGASFASLHSAPHSKLTAINRRMRRRAARPEVSPYLTMKMVLGRAKWRKTSPSRYFTE